MKEFWVCDKSILRLFLVCKFLQKLTVKNDMKAILILDCPTLLILRLSDI